MLGWNENRGLFLEEGTGLKEEKGVAEGGIAMAIQWIPELPKAREVLARPEAIQQRQRRIEDCGYR